MVALHATHLLTCHIAGTGHHCSPAIAQGLRLGKRLDLVREPANDHDPDAIAVQLGQQRIGYVPRRHNTVLARLLDAGKTLRARIDDAEGLEGGWMKVVMAVELTE